MDKEIKPVAEKDTGTPEGIFWVVLGAVMCALSYRLKLGSLHGPGPGFVAFLAGFFIAAVGVVMVLSKFLTRHRAEGTVSAPHPFRTVSWSRLVYTMCLLVAYAVLIESLGFMLTTFLVMFGLFFQWEKQNWFWSLFFATAASVTSYVVFEMCLRCQLPRGIFPWW
jgi:putative tricarboxylic transport membrane protein